MDRSRRQGEEAIINAAADGIHPHPASCGCGAPAGAALPLC